MTEKIDLPPGWASCKLGDVIPVARPKIPADPDSQFRFIGMHQIEPNSLQLRGNGDFAKMKSAGSYFQTGDVLYGRLRPYLNKVYRAEFEGVASSEFIVLPASEFYDSDFIKYLLHQMAFVKFATSQTSGDRPRVKYSEIANYEFYLPPHDEQRRIVEKIDKLFAPLYKGEGGLCEAHRLLALYRQSVLKDAFAGRLVPQDSDDEPASERLTHIIFESTPKSWSWVKLSDVVKINPGINKNEFNDDDELPFVPMKAVEAGTGRINTTERRRLGSVKTGFTAFSSGDVLFAKITPCMENGKMAIVPALSKGVGFGTTEFHVLRPSDSVDARFLYYFVSSASVRNEAQHQMTGAVGQKRVPRRYLENKLFPVPPLCEQRRIVERIDMLFTQANKLEEEIDITRRLLAHCRQSILKNAFTGRLVPQDPDDEPANELLARIQKAAPPHPQKGGQRDKTR